MGCKSGEWEGKVTITLLSLRPLLESKATQYLDASRSWSDWIDFVFFFLFVCPCLKKAYSRIWQSVWVLIFGPSSTRKGSAVAHPEWYQPTPAWVTAGPSAPLRVTLVAFAHKALVLIHWVYFAFGHLFCVWVYFQFYFGSVSPRCVTSFVGMLCLKCLHSRLISSSVSVYVLSPASLSCCYHALCAASSCDSSCLFFIDPKHVVLPTLLLAVACLMYCHWNCTRFWTRTTCWSRGASSHNMSNKSSQIRTDCMNSPVSITSHSIPVETWWYNLWQSAESKLLSNRL